MTLLGNKPPRADTTVSSIHSITHLAALHRMYSIQGVVIDSKNALVVTIVEDFYNLLLENGKLQDFPSVSAAIDYMTVISPTLMQNNRNRRSLIKSLQLEAAESGEAAIDEAELSTLIDQIKEKLD